MKEDKNKKRIINIANEIATLSAELNRLLKLDESNEEEVEPRHERKRKIKVGDRVVIINKYKGNYGKQGVVTERTKVFLRVKLDENGVYVTKAIKSVGLVA